MQSNPDINQLRLLMTAAEEQPATQPVTTARPRTNRPSNNGNKGGATQPRPRMTNPPPRDNGQMPTDTESTDMTGMTGMEGNNGNMDGMNGGMRGMDGQNDMNGMDGHDHTHEEPPIYSNPMVLGA